MARTEWDKCSVANARMNTTVVLLAASFKAHLAFTEDVREKLPSWRAETVV